MLKSRCRTPIFRSLALSAALLAAVGSGAAAAPSALASGSPTPATVVALPPAVTAGQGAAVPFTEYEAENAATNGAQVRSDHTYTTIAAEASGRRAVKLQRTHQYVEFTLAKPANAVTVRYAVPDTADGAGADSTLGVYTGETRIATLHTTSKYGWYYGFYPFTNVPSQLTPHHFFDEARVRLGHTYPAGSRIKVEIGVADTAPWYVLDLADFEQVPAAIAQPVGSLSLADYHADPTGVADSSDAIDAAIAGAEAADRTLYIPPGTYAVSRHFTLDKVTVQGAGQWYSVFTGTAAGFVGKSASDGGSSAVHLSGLAIIGNVQVRNDSDPVQGVGGTFDDSTISDLWIQHSKVGIWVDGPSHNLTISGLRILDEAADGVNFHNGVTDSAVENTFVRNSGDDGLAMWTDKTPDARDTFSHNTVVAPNLANNIAIYGGSDDSVVGNVVADTVTQGGGIHVGNRFGSVPLAGTTTIAHNTAVRAGVLDQFWHTGLGALWFWAADAPMTGHINVSNVNLIDSAYEAVQLHGSSITNLSLDRVNIAGAGTYAVQLEAAGSAAFSHVVAVGTRGQTYDCASGFAITQGTGNFGWQHRQCATLPTGPLTLSPSTLDFGHVTAGTTSDPQTVTVTNPTSQSQVIRSVVAAGQWTAVSSCGTFLAPHATCTVALRFAPTNAGAHTGTLTVSGSGSATQQLVLLSGDGLSAKGDFAEGRPATASATGYGDPANVTDGNLDSIWEGAENNGFPSSITIDTQNTEAIARAVLQLPDNPGWGIRTQQVAIDGSVDGTAFSPIVATRPVTFDAVNAHNTATVTFAPATVRYVRFTISANTGWTAAQLGEVHLYAFGQGPSANGDFAQGKPVTANKTGYGDAANVTDSNRDTIWEGTGNVYPATVTIDTQATQAVGRVVLQLPSCACWGVRTQNVEVDGSTDGTTWSTVSAARDVTFDGPGADNTAQVTFPSTPVRYLRVVVTSNSGSAAAQLAEVHVYAASDNLALGNPASASGTRYGSASQLTDGSVETLWEGPTGVYPTTVTVDLQSSYGVGRAVLQLPSCACWGTRTETLDVEGSTDGTTWSTLSSGPVVFDAANAHNTASLTFAAQQARWVRVTFHDNSGSDAAQLSELQLYAS